MACSKVWTPDSRLTSCGPGANSGKNTVLYTERTRILYLKYIQNYYFETYMLQSNTDRCKFGCLRSFSFVISLLLKTPEDHSLQCPLAEGGAQRPGPLVPLVVWLCSCTPRRPRNSGLAGGTGDREVTGPSSINHRPVAHLLAPSLSLPAAPSLGIKGSGGRAGLKRG